MLKVIGQPVNRTDGRLKVTGRAEYAGDRHFGRMVYAYGVMSSVASGRITRLDASAAEEAPGVISVYHFRNFPKTRFFKNDFEKSVKAAEARPPFEDQKIYYAGQFVALVVAETFAQARAAARLVDIDYRSERPTLTLDDGLAARRSNHPKQNDEETDASRGDPDGAFASATEKIDATYVTPVEVHNAMELHATTARWEGPKLIIYDSTQWVIGQRNTLARRLGVRKENIVVHAPFVGGGFGSKLFLWPHTVLAAVAAREIGRPVKLVLTRHSQFSTAGHRPFTRQRLRLAATPEGKLLSIRHDTLSHTSMVDNFSETCGKGTRSLYSCANVSVSHRVIPVNVGTPSSMRAPGAASGMFALESAMDELALQLKLDPVELRLRNLAANDEDGKLPWSSNHLDECYRQAAAKFGWSQRDPGIGAMRRGREILGWGFASAYWPSEREEANVRVELLADGTVRVACATQDIGTGTWTVFAQVVAEITSLPLERIDVVIGDSSLPPGPISGGSMVTATVVPAIAKAARNALKKLFAAATSQGGAFAGEDSDGIILVNGDLLVPASGRKCSWSDVFAQARLDQVVGKARAKPGKEAEQYSFHSFGAHCVEVRWDPGIAKLRVSRVTSAIDAGQIINPKTARNQIHGSLVMGLGMALQEEAIYDRLTGRVINDNLADYHVPVHADLPELDVILLDHPDPHTGEYGAKGIGEIGITGVAAAIANAVYHATGKRIRELPITTEKLLS